MQQKIERANMTSVSRSDENKNCLGGLLPEEIAALLPQFKAFKAREIFKNFSKGIFDFTEFTTLANEERKFLQKHFYASCTSIQETKVDSSGTKKISLELVDNNVIEAVLLTDKQGRKTVVLWVASFVKLARLGLHEIYRWRKLSSSFLCLKK